MSTITIERVSPRAGVCGGRVTVDCHGLDGEALGSCNIVFGSTPTRPLLASPTFVLGTVPPAARPDVIQLEQRGSSSNTMPFATASVLAQNLHPVANPVVDGQGTIYTTISGTKSQPVPVSIYRISPAGEVEPFASDILNPTGLAFGPDGLLYVSSRHTGTVFRVDQHGTVSSFVEHLGIATGIAFDAQGRLYVGDRRGTIYQVSDTGEARVFVSKLEQSVAAYHLAFGDNDRLYLSYPTLSGHDQVYCIAPDGDVCTIASGIGRALGLALDRDHNVYAVGHFADASGVVKITPAGDLELVISGVNLVGLAFGLDGELILVDNSTVYKLNFGVQGRPLL